MKGVKRMKRIILITMVAVLVAMVAVPAMAGSIVFSPGYVSMSVAPGTSSSQTITVSLVGAASGDNVTINGFDIYKIPAGWVSIPGQVNLTSLTTSTNITINANIPKNASEGTYRGLLYPSKLWAVGQISIKSGIIVSLTVSAAKCTVAPSFSGVSADTSSIEVPNNKTYNVGISGKVVNPDGCTLKGAWYTLVDEYGELGGTVKISPAADGSFSSSIPVQASRKGTDKDGRLYTITLGAENEAGAGSSSSFGVTVSHDQGKK